MALIPESFPQEPEAAIASFAFTDIAEGTGVQVFFGISSENFTSTVDYHLVGNSDVTSSQSSSSGAATSTTTIDFDTGTFNLPRTVRGTASFSAGMGVLNATMHLAAQVKKVAADNTVINLTSKQSGQIFTNAGTDSEMVFIPLPITATGSNAIIKKGEFLRLTVGLHQNTGGVNETELGHDPKNNDGELGAIKPGTKNTTVLRLLMPFEIKL